MEFIAENTIALFFAFVNVGGLTAILLAFIHRKKHKADVTDINVKTALELESKAVTRYFEMDTKLSKVEEMLSEVRCELNVQRMYNRQLEILLKTHNIDYAYLTEAFCKHCASGTKLNK